MDYDATGQPNGVDTRQCLDNNNITMYTPEQITGYAQAMPMIFTPRARSLPDCAFTFV